MISPVLNAPKDDATLSDEQRLIEHALDHAIHLIPSQGPISVFVHHNTLHALQSQTFEEAVVEGLNIYGCQPYFSEERYRRKLQFGRIDGEVLRQVLAEDLGSRSTVEIASLGDLFSIRLALLRMPNLNLPSEESVWLLSETDYITRFRPEILPQSVEQFVARAKQVLLTGEGSSFDADFPKTDAAWESYVLRRMWRACLAGTEHGRLVARDVLRPKVLRLRDLLHDRTGEDADLLVNEVLIRFASSYLDQGLAAWELPNRNDGFLRSFARMYTTNLGILPSWMRSLKADLLHIERTNRCAYATISRVFADMQLAKDHWSDYLTQTVLSLRGWAGMMWQMESNAPWTPKPAPRGSLVEFVAIKLLLDHAAAKYIAQANGVRFKENAFCAYHKTARRMSPSQALTVFQIAQFLNWTFDQLESLTPEDWVQVFDEIIAFDELERRRVFHLAYERTYRNAAIDAVSIHSSLIQRAKPHLQRTDSEYQVVTCIDDREESFRRHLEEICPACETFGAAGFYGVVMYYRGVAEAHYRPLCPINATPRHYVCEEPMFSAASEEVKRSARRKLIGTVTHTLHTNSRTLLGGLVTGVLGTFATIPLVARVLAPRVTAKLRSLISTIVQPPATELHLERKEPEPGPDYDSLGFQVEEMASIVTRILEDIGLVKNFSPLVLFLGHGSSSLNNPHESAYNCGACSGGRGGPNARSFATMANDRRVRALVAQKGIHIPEQTHFIGGFHNTCTDRVDYYDLDEVPRLLRNAFRKLEADVTTARRRNALERSRRFEHATFDMTPEQALAHVEERAEDLSQTRPEYNHATNALCFVGQREWSRGLFLDRRAFLTSYDPSVDDSNGRILERILQAAIPVCGGISLEYYFSTVDPEGYGCGSKLPHNIVSLAGVMTGAASDLRPGLSAQMVEIHEPFRILFVVQTNEEVIRRIIKGNEAIRSLVEGNWVQLAILDVDTNRISTYEKGKFVPHKVFNTSIPVVNTSLDWFEGKRDHLGFATIKASLDEFTGSLAERSIIAGKVGQ